MPLHYDAVSDWFDRLSADDQELCRTLADAMAGPHEAAAEGMAASLPRRRGQNYGGSYTVQGSTVTVRCGMNVKSAELGGVAASADTLARMLLADIVSDRSRVDRE